MIWAHARNRWYTNIISFAGAYHAWNIIFQDGGKERKEQRMQFFGTFPIVLTDLFLLLQPLNKQRVMACGGLNQSDGYVCWNHVNVSEIYGPCWMFYQNTRSWRNQSGDNLATVQSVQSCRCESWVLLMIWDGKLVCAFCVRRVWNVPPKKCAFCTKKQRKHILFPPRPKVQILMQFRSTLLSQIVWKASKSPSDLC